MKRLWNAPIWLGFVAVLAGLLTYLPVFARFASTRDVPWVNLLMMGAGLVLTGYGLAQAYRKPQIYRGRVAGTILMGLAAALSAFFIAGTFYFARQLPASEGAPRVGEKAPDFTLPDKDGNLVTLSKLLTETLDGKERLNGAVLIFYRGHW
jgi:hypothetical protein